MIRTPYHFEADLSDQDFQKIGQFACRWAHIEYTIGNCLRVMLGLGPKHAAIMIFPLNLDTRMKRISELLARHPTLLNDYQRSGDDVSAVIAQPRLGAAWKPLAWLRLAAAFPFPFHAVTLRAFIARRVPNG